MRIAVVNWTRRSVGGVEQYLTDVMPALVAAGHDVAFWCEVDQPIDRRPIPLPEGVPVICAATQGVAAAIAGLRAWNPDLLYVHGLEEPEIEEQLLAVAPAVLFVHGYYGTCISGAKTFKNPVITPCHRTFGWQCLLQYYPRRCGGWSPVTMVREFHRQTDRRELLARYRAIVTHSSHMQREYSRHGLSSSQIFNIRYASASEAEGASAARRVHAHHGGAWRLLFVGRMDRLKGGRELLESLPGVVKALQHDVHLTLAGDGPAQQEWRRQAADICRREPKLRVDFCGWVGREEIEHLFANADLLVLPSLWPEPFGLVGLEAARHRLPVAAFAVGGIPDWLQPGINGYLANGDPPTTEGFTEAIAACLKNRGTHERLRDGAARVSAAFDYRQHLDTLLRIFADVAHAA